jgi:hypothetical protein
MQNKTDKPYFWALERAAELVSFRHLQVCVRTREYVEDPVLHVSAGVG